MLRLLVVLCASTLLLAAGCGDGSREGDDSAPNATSTLEIVATSDDVIDLAVQLDTMTREQAICVFQDHPSIFQEFLQTSGLDPSVSVDEATVKQQLQDLKTTHAVQLDRCFADAAG